MSLTRLAATAASIIGALVAIAITLLSPPSQNGPTSGASGTAESCLGCHRAATDGPGGPHTPATVGCTSCHLGDPAASTQAQAHLGLELEPGALDTADLTCGTCHARELGNVRSSLMTTGVGLIAVNRWAFGELPHPDGHETFAELLGAPAPTAAQDHLRRLCAGCHLGSRKANRDDAVPAAEGSGCSACHLTPRRGKFEAHSTIGGPVADARCLGCHSRSSRISLSYQGLAEMDGPDAEACEDPVMLHDGRAGCALAADVHHDAQIGCTDCHVHSELMGDGVARAHQEQQLEIRCQSCHGPVAPHEEARWEAVDDPITSDLLRLRGQVRRPDEAVRLGSRGTPLWNIRPREGSWWLDFKGRPGTRRVTPTPDNAAHTMPGHERLSCASCHSAWAPNCTSCHTRFDAQGEQWDFAAGAVSPGRWIETNDGMGVASPALGVDAQGNIRPAIPGMIAMIDGRAAGGDAQRLRAFSLPAPHTTAKAGRRCLDCHWNAATLGLGVGALVATDDGLDFRPAHEDPAQPGASIDRWTTLFPLRPQPGTRRGARSLDAAEQRRALRVGACLACHGGGEGLGEGLGETTGGGELWADFPEALQRLTAGDAGACQGRVQGWMSDPSTLE